MVAKEVVGSTGCSVILAPFSRWPARLQSDRVVVLGHPIELDLEDALESGSAHLELPAAIAVGQRRLGRFVGFLACELLARVQEQL
jgi:hypothetical protein